MACRDALIIALTRFNIYFETALSSDLESGVLLLSESGGRGGRGGRGGMESEGGSGGRQSGNGGKLDTSVNAVVFRLSVLSVGDRDGNGSCLMVMSQLWSGPSTPSALLLLDDLDFGDLERERFLLLDFLELCVGDAFLSRRLDLDELLEVGDRDLLSRDFAGGGGGLPLYLGDLDLAFL